MFKTLRVILNNMDEKPYVKGKTKFKLYKDTEKNLTPLSKDSKEMQRIDALETTVRYNNLKIYASNMAKLRGKQFSLIVLPVLLGSLTIFTWVGKGYNKTEVLPTYQKVVIEMDEENLYKDGVEPEKYVYTVFGRTFTDGQNAVSIDGTTSKARINFGEGENAVQVVYNVDTDGTWDYSSYTTESFFNLEGKNLDNAMEIPTKYDNIIDEAAAIFKSHLSSGSKTAKLVDEILTNEKNDIIVRIEQFEKIGDYPYETHHSYWLWRILLIICDVVLGCLLAYYRDDVTQVNVIESNKGELYTYSRTMSIIHAVMKYKEALLQAEIERISEIDTITKKNNGTGEILSKFEKKLIL